MRSAVIVCVGMLVSAVQAGPTLRLIGNPDGPIVIPFPVSGDGRVSGGYFYGEQDGEPGATAGVWSFDRGLVAMPGPLLPFSADRWPSVFALSQDGSAASVLSAQFDGREDAFIWTDDGAVTDMGNLGGVFPPDLPFARAYAVTNDGDHAAGGSASLRGYEAFLWRRDIGMVGLGDLNTADEAIVGSYATWISEDGARVRGIARVTDERSEIFEWSSSGGMIAISDSSAFGELNQVLSTAGDGSAMGGLFRVPGSDLLQGFLWTEAGGLETLPNRPDGSRFVPVAVSGGGRVVMAVNGDIWTPGSGFQSLVDLAGLAGTTGGDIELIGTAISTDGNIIVGQAFVPGPDITAQHGFFLTLDDPCPPDLNRDGAADFFDLLGFILAFNVGDFFADENLDGRLDFFDVQQYLSSLSGGCL